MDFEGAIVAHARWKYRLSDYVAGKSQEKLDVAVVGCDDKCDLGKWIHSHTERDKGASAVGELRKEHAAFHLAAAAVVRAAQSGKKSEALQMLEPSGLYAELSVGVINLIAKMRNASKA